MNTRTKSQDSNDALRRCAKVHPLTKQVTEGGGTFHNEMDIYL